jgi:hypothetical protein
MTKLPPLSEHTEQANFVSEVYSRYTSRPDFIPVLFYAVVNGFYVASNKPSKFALLAKYKAEGWRPGVADVHYDQPRGDYCKLVIEMKRSDKRNTKDGGLTPEQKEYLEAAASVGAFTDVCYCAEEAFETFSKYMSLEAK